MSDRVWAVIHYGREVGNIVRSSHVVPSAVDITDVTPQPTIGWRYDGETFAPPPPFAVDEASSKANAIAEVNRRAGEARAKYLTVVPGQAETYLLKADELRAYDAAIAANAPIVAADYPILASEAAATRATLADTVALVRATRAQWLQLAAVVEGIRRGAIVAIEAATSDAAVRAAIPETWP